MLPSNFLAFGMFIRKVEHKVQSLFLNVNQLNALNFIIRLFQACTCFEHMCSSSGGQKLYYTVSGIITPIGGRPVHRLIEDDEHMCSKHVEA